MPKEANSETIKDIAGAKHVIGASTKIDNIKNECVGTGNLQVRLGEGESEEQIVQRLKNNGINARRSGTATRKHNNYKDLASTNWKDSHLQVQEKRHVKDEFGKPHDLLIA